jgi:hypothetical protein
MNLDLCRVLWTLNWADKEFFLIFLYIASLEQAWQNPSDINPRVGLRALISPTRSDTNPRVGFELLSETQPYGQASLMDGRRDNRWRARSGDPERDSWKISFAPRFNHLFNHLPIHLFIYWSDHSDIRSFIYRSSIYSFYPASSLHHLVVKPIYQPIWQNEDCFFNELNGESFFDWVERGWLFQMGWVGTAWKRLIHDK